MTKQWFVYRLERPDGTPFYVGKGSRKRMRRSPKDTHNPHKKRVVDEMRARGESVVTIIVGQFEVEADATASEMAEIARIGRFPKGPLTNLTDGGAGLTGFVYSEEDRRNMSLSKLGKVRPKDVIAK